MGRQVQILVVNDVEYPISNTSYMRVLDEISHVECGTEEGSVQVVEIVCEERHLKFCVSLRGLRYVSTWRQYIDQMIYDSEQIARSRTVKSVPANDILQREFAFS